MIVKKLTIAVLGVVLAFSNGWSQGRPAAKADDQLAAAHIIIQYKGSARASSEITRSKEEARQLTVEIAEMAQKEGADFAALAKQYSDGPSAPRGGKLGNFRPAAMAKPFTEAVQKLEIGGISGVVETQFGYHVIQRLEVKEPKKASAKHILVMYKGSMRAPGHIERTQEQALELAQAILKKAQAGEKFEELARQFSDGPSATQGGDLGEFPEGMMHVNFEEATFACEVGGLTDIVETPFGYHIIYRYK